MNSLNSISALELSRQTELGEATYISLVALQKTLTMEVAATASTVTQVIAVHGEPTATKLVCAILKLFNDGLNTTLQMTSRQLFEYAQVWLDEFPHDTIKDLVLCLKRVKAGRYGPIFNRVDGTVVSDFFRKYLEEKADWGEQENRKYKSDCIKQGQLLMDAMSADQAKEVKLFIQRAKVKVTPQLVDPNSPLSSDEAYCKYMALNAEDIEFEVLEDVKKRAEAQNIPEVLAIVENELTRRNDLIENAFDEYEN